MDLDKLRIFHAVAQAQSLTHAGEKLNLSQSAVSRQISALEESLSVSLFSRHARGLLLTEQGEILFKTVSDVLSRLRQAESALLDSKERPRGPLKITAPTAIGTMWLVPHLKEFCDLYPEIQVTLIATDRELDLTQREADVAIRSYPATHPDLVQKKLTTLSNSLYAAKSYIREFGQPRKAIDLSQHRLITYAEEDKQPFDEINWILREGKNAEERTAYFRINSLRGMLRAVESGIGIAGLPDYIAHDAPHLVRVIPELHGPATDLYYTYSVELRNSKRVRVLKEFVIKKLQQDGFSAG